MTLQLNDREALEIASLVEKSLRSMVAAAPGNRLELLAFASAYNPTSLTVARAEIRRVLRIVGADDRDIEQFASFEPGDRAERIQTLAAALGKLTDQERELVGSGMPCNRSTVGVRR
jgi:hypothetical protein